MTKGHLDPVDRKIMEVLQESGRLEYVHLASKVGRSTSSTVERVEKLCDLGYIKRFTAIVDRKLLGRPTLMIALVKLKGHGTKELRSFPAALKAYSEVQMILHLSGEFDFLLQVNLCDSQEYEVFLDQKLCCLPMVAKVQSSLVLKEHKMDLTVLLA